MSNIHFKFYHFVCLTTPDEETQAFSRQSSLMDQAHAALLQETCPPICLSFSESRKIIHIWTIIHGGLPSSTLKISMSTRSKLEPILTHSLYPSLCLQANNIGGIRSLSSHWDTCAVFVFSFWLLCLYPRHTCRNFTIHASSCDHPINPIQGRSFTMTILQMKKLKAKIMCFSEGHIAYKWCYWSFSLGLWMKGYPFNH